MLCTPGATIRQLRLRLLPFLLLAYIVAFVDRTNIGFAALTMNEELLIASQQFGFVAGVFFLGYFLFEIPSNLLLHRIGARIWIPRILLTWGVIAMMTGFVRTAAQLYVARFTLGLAEAGFFPGIALYLTYWFPQRELARALALILVGIPIASIVSSPTSGFILDHVHWLHASSWRWLLILEGAPAVLCGLLAFRVLPNHPQDASFLNRSQVEWIAKELAREERYKLKTGQPSVVQVLHDSRVWHLACIGFAHGVASYTLLFWLPQLINSLLKGHSPTVIGSILVIPYTAGLVGMIFASRNSDRTLERRYHVAFPAFVAGVALIEFGFAHGTALPIALLSVATLGIFSTLPPFFSLPSEFLAGFSAASGIALTTSIANLGGFVGPYLVGLIRERTGSLTAGLFVAGLSLLGSAILALLLPKGALSRMYADCERSVVTDV